MHLEPGKKVVHKFCGKVEDIDEQNVHVTEAQSLALEMAIVHGNIVVHRIPVRDQKTCAGLMQ